MNTKTKKNQPRDGSYYADGLNIFKAPIQRGNNVTMGFCFAEADSEENATTTALMLNQHKELRGSLQELIDVLTPTMKAEHRLSQGVLSAIGRGRQLLATIKD